MPTKTTINNVSKHLFVNKQHMKKLYENCVDFVISPLEIESQPYMMLMYLNSLIDEPRVNEAIINPIVQSYRSFLIERENSHIYNNDLMKNSSQSVKWKNRAR